MYTPTVLIGFGGKSLTINHYPIVYFRMTSNNYTSRGEKVPDSAKFKMNPKYQYKVTKFFLNILSWMSIEDLFIFDENDNRLLVNLDYKDLKAEVHGAHADPQIMMATPAAVNIDSKWYKGACIYFNFVKNAVIITEEDIEAICGILSTFSFQQEALLLMKIAEHPEWHTTEPNRFSGDRRTNPFGNSSG